MQRDNVTSAATLDRATYMRLPGHKRTPTLIKIGVPVVDRRYAADRATPMVQDGLDHVRRGLEAREAAGRTPSQVMKAPAVHPAQGVETPAVARREDEMDILTV